MFVQSKNPYYKIFNMPQRIYQTIWRTSTNNAAGVCRYALNILTTINPY